MGTMGRLAMSYIRFPHLLPLSLQSLVLHRLRSFQSMLSVVLGVASVILMLAVRYEPVRQIQELGAFNIILRSIKPLDDREASEDNIPLSYGVTPADME